MNINSIQNLLNNNQIQIKNLIKHINILNNKVNLLENNIIKINKTLNKELSKKCEKCEKCENDINTKDEKDNKNEKDDNLNKLLNLKEKKVNICLNIMKTKLSKRLSKDLLSN